MNPILTTTILIATAFAVQADERSVGERARETAGSVIEKTREVVHETKEVIVGAAGHAGRATRAAWGSTKAYASDDTPVYREGAHATLADLAREIADLKAQTSPTAPAYFRTRLLALEQQHEDLAKRLALLSPEHLNDRSSGSRHDFDQCVGDLEQAIDQAKDGAGTLPQIALK